jgi:hypothetical protein
MIVNAAVFTCSICGEASVNICSYCTKDACSNHRCERCKRCSDCCECEFPLSAEEPVAVEAATEPVLPPEPESPQPEVSAVDIPGPAAPPPPPEIFERPPERQSERVMPGFLTREESSVFVEGSVFFEPDEPADSSAESGAEPRHDDPTDPHQ